MATWKGFRHFVSEDERVSDISKRVDKRVVELEGFRHFISIDE